MVLSSVLSVLAQDSPAPAPAPAPAEAPAPAPAPAPAGDSGGGDNSTAAAGNTTAGNDTAGGDDGAAAGGGDGAAAAGGAAAAWDQQLDPLFGCYCPGDSDIHDKFKDQPADYKLLMEAIGERRRAAQQNFTVSVIPAAVEAAQHSRLPSASVLSKMFPDLGDGFAVDTWLASLSAITYKAVKDIKNTTTTKMTQRLEAAAAIGALKAKFDYSKYVAAPAPAPAPAPAAEGGDTAASEDTGTGEGAQESGDGARRRRQIVTTTLVTALGTRA